MIITQIITEKALKINVLKNTQIELEKQIQLNLKESLHGKTTNKTLKEFLTEIKLEEILKLLVSTLETTQSQEVPPFVVDFYILTFSNKLELF